MAALKSGGQELTQSTMDFLKEKWRSAAWSVIVIAVLTTICLILGKNMIAIGLCAGWIVSVINYILLAYVIDLAVQRYRRSGDRILTLLLMAGGYHGRFWGLIAVLYFAFQRYGTGFGFAFIIGMSLLKWVTVCEAIDSAFSEDI